MSSSGPASPSLPLSGSIDVDRMTFQQISSELKAYRPTLQNDINTDEAWRDRRARLWRRLDLLRDMQGMYNRIRR